MAVSRTLVVAAALLVFGGRARAQEVAAVGSAKPLPEPTAELGKLLAVYDKDPEPVREVKRLYASSLYYLLERHLDAFLLCFHKDFQIHDGTEVTALPPADLRARVEKAWKEVPKSTLSLEELVILDQARAYTREQAKKWIGDWKKQPSEIARVMQDGDMLVIAPTNRKALGEKASDFSAEVFYVMRKQDDSKIVLGE